MLPLGKAPMYSAALREAAPASPVLNVRQAAEYLGVSKSYLDKARVSGTGPAFCKLGNRVLYQRQVLDAFMDSHVRHSTSEAA